MRDMSNKFKITMALKSIFLSVVLLLVYSYKREVDINIAYIIVCAVSLSGIYLYFKNVKKYVLTQKIKQLYNVDIISKDFESAKALVHRGRFNVALLKFKSVMADNPDNENIKIIINEIEQYVN